jgi:hypothetical protein
MRIWIVFYEVYIFFGQDGCNHGAGLLLHHARCASGLSSMKYTYSLVRMVATMALACCFIMLDAQTIQVRDFCFVTPVERLTDRKQCQMLLSKKIDL